MGSRARMETLAARHRAQRDARREPDIVPDGFAPHDDGIEARQRSLSP
jgi:hypothetical protein